MKKARIYTIALILFLISGSLMYYKVTKLGMPLIPSQQSDVWVVEAKLQFQASGGPAKAAFYIPNDPPGFVRLNEDFISSNYGLATNLAGENRKAEWAVRRAKGKQVLYYRMEFTRDSGNVKARTLPRPTYPQAPVHDDTMQAAINAVLNDVRAHSADIATFTRELLVRLNNTNPDQNISLINKVGHGSVEWVRQLVNILATARIPARIVYVLPLQDLVKHGQLIPWIEVHNDFEWIAFDPVTGQQGFRDDILVWRTGDDPLVTIHGGKPAEVDFSMSRQSHSQVSVAEQWARKTNSALMDFSLFALPVQTQNVYRIILMVPLGALVIVVLRNLIGLATFGTFMPVLVAMAFRETSLMWGVIMFTTLVSVGLILRSFLENLHLLLVPRLAAVLTIVIMLIAAFSIISVRLDMERGLSVALFPVVILAMTIERMSIVLEETGSKEAFKLGFGSLVAAIIGYLVMTNEILGHLIFVFPELLLVVLAMTMLVGRYTGYRLMELWRFRGLMKDADKP
ncbi:MAG: inactive transglutaminase family protein [Gammaproteobacteria bacterium]